MSLDRSLKSKNALVRSRNVLTRSERVVALKEQDRWSEGDSVFGLPKVRQRRSKAGTKTKAAAPAAEAAVPEAEAGAETKVKEPAKGEKS